MSKVPRNKKYLELQGIRVYHDKKDGSIQLISTDPDLKGRPFHITLNHGTQTERSVRELLLNKGVITPEQFSPQDYLPKIAAHPHLLDVGSAHSYSWNEIPIGVTKNLEPVVLDLKSAPHVLIGGPAGSGKSILINNLLMPVLQRPDEWQVAAVDLLKVESAHLTKRQENVYGLAFNLDEVVTLFQRLTETVAERLSLMERQGVNSFKELDSKVPAIMVVLDEATFFLNERGGSSEEAIIHDQKVRTARVLLQSLIKVCKTAGVQIIMVTQRLDSPVLSGEFLSRFSNRIAVGPLDREESRHIIMTDAATQNVVNPGRALLLREGKLTSLQIFDVRQSDFT